MTGTELEQLLELGSGGEVRMPAGERVSTTSFGDQGGVAAVEVEGEGEVAVTFLGWSRVGWEEEWKRGRGKQREVSSTDGKKGKDSSRASLGMEEWI